MNSQPVESIPFATNQIVRPRLMTLLAQAETCPVTLISAPPGYGKTTLVAQFSRQVTQTVIWHTIRERERDAPNLHQKSLQIFRGETSTLRAISHPPSSFLHT